ncbi:MAG: hypothetical protein P1V20_20670 [Verrucomicrobiales bacterium]|nr:hypothetical protein [Verrucomicrobiales bacterium]
MQAIYESLYRPGIPLQVMGILIGLWLIGTHGFAWLKPDETADFLKKFPRNEKIGSVLTVIGFIWTFIVWSQMDLGEFYKVKHLVQVVLIAGCVGVIVYVKEFIAVRSTGFLLILLAGPILVSAFLKEPVSRLLIVALAYGGALVGMFWVGMPYLMRDQIDWVLEDRNRLKKGAIGGAAFGGLVLICALAFWR